MVFKKGEKSKNWNGFKKGHIVTEKTRKKLRLSKLGDRNPVKRQEVKNKIQKTMKGKHTSQKTEFKKGNKVWNDGLTKETDERLRKLSIKMLDRNISWGKKISLGLKGRKQSMKERINRSASLQGIELKDWKGFVTPLRSKIWFSNRYKIWRKKVFERDNYTCQECGNKGKLQAHHIIPFMICLKENRELIFDVDNGKTLCLECHKKHNGINQYTPFPLISTTQRRQL